MSGLELYINDLKQIFVIGITGIRLVLFAGVFMFAFSIFYECCNRKAREMLPFLIVLLFAITIIILCPSPSTLTEMLNVKWG